MNYTVIGSDGFEDELAAVWLAAADRNLLTALTSAIEQILQQTPFAIGQPYMSSVNRVIVVPPLGLLYDIVEDDKKVIVQSCWTVAEK